MTLATTQLELFRFDNTNISSTIPTTKPKVISLFCGCGGFDYGFHQAGYEIVFAKIFLQIVSMLFPVYCDICLYRRKIFGPLHPFGVRGLELLRPKSAP